MKLIYAISDFMTNIMKTRYFSNDETGSRMTRDNRKD